MGLIHKENEMITTLINSTSSKLPFKDKIFHTIVTSPPYHNLRVYEGMQKIMWHSGWFKPMPNTDPIWIESTLCAYGNEKSISEYIYHSILIIRELMRVLRDDGVLWWNIGDNYIKTDDENIDSGNIAGIPYRMLFAIQATGYIVRNDLVFAKKAPMPESINSWRFAKDACDCVTENREAAIAESVDLEGVNRHRTYDLVGNKFGPNPLCQKCSGTGFTGEINFKSGSWRHTRSHESILMIVKQPGYYANREAIKEPAKNWGTRDRTDNKYHKSGTGLQPHGGLDDINFANRGKNPRDVIANIPEDNLQNILEYLDNNHPDILAQMLRDSQNPIDVTWPQGSNYKGKHFACVDSETECLTIGGWKRYDQIKPGMPIFTYNIETEELEIQPVNDIGIYEYKGNLVSVFGRSSNMLMTPNHRCVVTRYLHRQKKEGKPTTVTADNLKCGMKYIVAAHLSQKNLITPNESPEFFELLGWFLAEGSYRDNGTVSLSQSKTTNPTKTDRIDYLLTTMGRFHRAEIDLKENGILIEWRINGDLRKKIKLYFPDKFRIPEHFLTLPDEYIKAFLAGFVGGDGNIRNDQRISITQKSKQVLDIIQAMYLRIGKSCILSQRGNGIWTAFITNADRRHFRNAKSSLIRNDYLYHGIVWCPSVRNGTWIARRGGRPFITGNTFSESLIAPLIKATTPQQCCPNCGQGWSPVIETKRSNRNDDGRTHSLTDQRMGNNPVPERGWQTEETIIEYRPTCTCNIEHDWDGNKCKKCYIFKTTSQKYCSVAGIVFDPFVGSGTTLLVSRNLGLNSVGTDISYKYIDREARRRLNMPIKTEKEEKTAKMALFSEEALDD